MSGKRIAIVQSNYIPWKGYFDLIGSVDECVLFDDVQYTRRDWRNRNRIKTPNGCIWLTIPVQVKGRYYQKIKDTEVSDQRWRAHHWKSIQANYARAPYFAMYKDWLADLYLASEAAFLSQVNYQFLAAFCTVLGITTRLTWSRQYELLPGKTERLVAICQQAGANVYLSGPAAKTYLDEILFNDAGIAVEWMKYDGYPEYHQLFPPFEHAVSIVDLLLNEGPQATRYMKSFSSSTVSPVSRDDLHNGSAVT
jgi:hypothetical protein